QQIADMSKAEDTLLADRERMATDRYRQAVASGAIGTILSLAIAGIAIVVVWQELGRRRQAENSFRAQAEEARINAERFRLLTQSVCSLIWISRPDGAVMFLNNGWGGYTGQTCDEQGRAEWLSAIHPDDVERLQSIWSKPSGGSQDLYQHEVRVRRGADQ